LSLNHREKTRVFDKSRSVPLTGTTEDERQAIRLTGTSDVGSLVPTSAQSELSGTIYVNPGSLAEDFEAIETMPETSHETYEKRLFGG
jgi:hypothetical protein